MKSMEKEHVSSEYEKAIAYIYGLIQDGTLTVGSRLPTERMIAQTLGIGRNSTREALSILHGMGLVERVQGSGNYISKNAGNSICQILTILLALGSITKQDVCEFRRVMEKSVCMVLLKKGLSESQRQQFEKLLAAMEHEDGGQLVALDQAFHESLIAATENGMFLTVMEAVTVIYRQWIDLVLSSASAREKQMLLGFHRAIYEHLLDGDEQALFAAIDGHYDMIEEKEAGADIYGMYAGSDVDLHMGAGEEADREHTGGHIGGHTDENTD